MKLARRRNTKVRAKAPERAGRPAPEAAESRQIAMELIDWSFAVRPLNVAHVGRLGDAAHLPAISVWEFEPGRYRGIDGYHRWRLAKARGAKTVSAGVQQFPPGKAGEKAFDFACVQSNLQHGLPLTREERDRAVVRIWNRWGHSGARADGETLDGLGVLFNLTKQRIHQILSANHRGELSRAPLARQEAASLPRSELRPPPIGRRSTGGRFSTFGRFSAGTRRLSRLLADTDFVGRLLREHRSEALKELQEVRGLIDQILASKS